MENEFKFASKEEQLKRANAFLVLGYLIFFAVILAIMWVFLAMGIRSMGLTMIITVMVVLFAVILLVLSKVMGASPKLKYMVMPFTCFISFFVGIAFNQGFVQLLGLFPLIGCILFYDKKYIRICNVTYGLLEIVVCAFKIVGNQNLENGSPVDQIFVTIVYFILMVLIVLVTNVASKFNNDTLGQVSAEKDKIQAMMEDVMTVAGEVRNGTEHAMDIINSLNASTEMVNGAMKDISSSTLSTAENIQTQTEMTTNIQESIENTLKTSDQMIEVAKESERINDKSLEVMNQLKEQSRVIADTNSEVARAMSELRDRTDAVKNIADTIFSISNQTNLLALNASIESARAGEAGKGFAVVADEIRQLAERSRQETEGIAKISEELSTTASTASDAVSKSVEATAAQDGMISEASECFNEINQNMGTLMEEIKDLAKMLGNLSDANNQIVDNITNLSATTEEVTASSSQASEISNENLENAETARTKLMNVLDVSHQLDKYMN